MKRKFDSSQDLLQAMVSFDTVNSHISGKADAELELSIFLESYAQNLGFTTRRLPVTANGFNLLVSHQVSDQAPWLLFESHLDTVSVAGMTIDPFAGEIRQERLYGRGACDTKASGTAMLQALKRYSFTPDPANNVAILYTLDEEVSKIGITTFVDNDLPFLGWTPAGVIVGEPTQSRLVVAHNGAVRWRIRTRGIAAHSSLPSRGRSAISMMVQVVQAVETNYIPNLGATCPLTGEAQCSINLIQGGSQINIIPESCEIQIDRRVVPGEDQEQVLSAVEPVLDRLRSADPEMIVEQVAPDVSCAPLSPDQDPRFVAFIQQTLNRLGLPHQPVGAGYGTDASSFNGTGIPVAVMGPGDVAQAHTHDEWIDLQQLAQGEEVYFSLMSSTGLTT